MKTALVTGASGFIGRVLCYALKRRGYHVLALMRMQVQGPWDCVLPVDLADGEVQYILDQAGTYTKNIDLVFHLASLVHATRVKGFVDDDYFRLNVEGTRKMVDVARRVGVRSFVYFSSVKAVEDPGEACVDESWDRPARDVYGRSKYLAEQQVLSLCDSGVRASVLRPALVYGEGVRGNLLRMLMAIDRGRMPNVNQTRNKRSMISVDDLVELAIMMAEKPQAAGKIYFATDGEQYSTKRIYDAIAAALGRRPGIRIPVWMIRGLGLILGVVEIFLPDVLPVSKEMLDRLVGSACYVSDKVVAEMDWHPTATFESAIQGIVEHYKEV